MAAVGKCRHCGREPVVQGEPTCPHCHGVYPNPSPFFAACERAVKICVLLGACAGLVWGLTVVGGVVGVVVGPIVGVLGGLFLGLIGGVVWGIVASAKRH